MKFEEIASINVNEHTEKKKTGSTELTYLSWAWAWKEFKKIYPDATYEIKTFADADCVQKPYMYDKNTGYMVMTSVTADGLTYDMWLPVMDNNNKAMKSEYYEYTTKFGTKTVDVATMFDVNKTIMRCLVKNLAMFGLGLYIYAGEDLPGDTAEEIKAFEKEATAEKTAKTRAINKGKQPKPSNKSLETRYNDALNYVKNINKEEYLDKSKSIKDKLNTLLFDLKEKGCAGWYDNLMLEYNRLTSLEDSIPY